MGVTRRVALELLAFSAAALGGRRALAAAGTGPTPPELLNRPPVIDLSRARLIAPGVTVIEDPRINLVPNVGIVEGEDAVLVVDAGLGPRNGAAVHGLAREIAGRRDLLLTLSHFHPEHGYGAQSFAGDARILYNLAQADELSEKGAAYLDLFRGFGPQVAAELEGTVLVGPDETYDGEREIDLGGRRVILREMPAHTRGDQIVLLPDDGIVFAGDLVENAFYPILPDADAHARLWIERLAAIESLGAGVVVPGHGAPGDLALVDAYREYFAFVEDAVAGAVAKGMTAVEADAALTPVVQERYAAWDNAFWAPFAIRVLHHELSGDPLELPSF